MLVFNNVTKSYKGSGKNAVEELTLEVKNGEIFGFLGPNGAGKSTTIKMATGILTIDKGDILVNGKSIKSQPEAVKAEIGYVSDNHVVYDKLTGYEYLSFIGSVYNVGKNDLATRTKNYAEMFNLSGAMSSQISTYSHGMKQKMVVIAALVHNPSLWILDEPLTGLDPQSAFDLKKLMRSHADEGNTVFFSSHVIDVVEKVCDRVAIINDGRLIKVGTIDEIAQIGGGDKTLEETFIDLTNVKGAIDFFDENEGR